MNDKRKQVLGKIKSGKVVFLSSWQDISLSDLLSVDENNISYLEHAFRNKVFFSKAVKREIFSNFQALCICATKNFFGWVDAVENEDIYFEKMQDGTRLIDYIFENHVEKNFGFYSMFKKRVEIVDYILKYERNKIRYLSPEIIKLLLTKQNGSYPVDKYINYSEMKWALLKNDFYRELLAYCKAKNNYDLLKDAMEGLLLYEMEDGKKVIEFLLDKGIEPSFVYGISSSEILNILVRRNRIDLLYKADVSLLLSPYDNDRTYFDLMFEKQREGVDVHLEKVSFEYFCHSAELTAKELIKFAQNDYQMFVPSISKRMLLYKGNKEKKSVLEYLVDIDKELTISKILPCCLKRNDPELVIVLRNLGIEDTAIDIRTEDVKFSDTYIEEYNEKYASECESVCPELLDELRDLFYSDGVSDKSAIDSLIISYTYLTSDGNLNKEMFIQELKKLIEIKKNNFDNFTYTKIEDGAYFRRGEGISLNNNVISTINHETSHALHYYLASDYVPENYFDVISRVRASDGIIDRVSDYSKRIAQLKENIRTEISKSKIEEYYEGLYQGDKLLELSLFLGMSKEKQKEKLIGDYNEQVLDVILASTYSVDEFINQRIQIEVDEMVDAVFRNDYDALIAIGDIIDAIFMGKFKNGALFDNEGIEIQPTYGHGIGYYDSNKNNGFSEMIANYGSIIKSRNSEEILAYLRSIVGDEVVDMIKDVYENNILKLQVYEQESEVEGVEHAR
ncbi:MAG: hypothetical protein IKF82_08180 [Bacilli bacterium]|nr:hypothetical protein [Bacilli bacterium]